MKFFETHEPDSTAYVSSVPVQVGNLERHFVNVPIRSTTDLDQIRAEYTKKLQAEDYGEFACSLTVFRSESDQILRPGFTFDFRVFAWGDWGDEEDEVEDLESELDDENEEEEEEEEEEGEE